MTGTLPNFTTDIPKSPREFYRLAAAETADGPRLVMTVYRRHQSGKVAPLRCVARLRPDALGELSDALATFKRLFEKGARDGQ